MSLFDIAFLSLVSAAFLSLSLVLIFMFVWCRDAAPHTQPETSGVKANALKASGVLAH